MPKPTFNPHVSDAPRYGKNVYESKRQFRDRVLADVRAQLEQWWPTWLRWTAPLIGANEKPRADQARAWYNRYQGGQSIEQIRRRSPDSSLRQIETGVRWYARRMNLPLRCSKTRAPKK